MLNIHTPYGDHYKVNEKGEIIRQDIKGFTPSGQWKFLGLRHVKKTTLFIPFSELTPNFSLEIIAGRPLRYKNGNPQWIVEDLDHGTRRTWGNTHVHGVSEIYFD